MVSLYFHAQKPAIDGKKQSRCIKRITDAVIPTHIFDSDRLSHSLGLYTLRREVDVVVKVQRRIDGRGCRSRS